MAIKNYTSGVDVYTSLGEIQGALAKHGATKIVVDYKDGRPSAVSFQIETANGLRGFILPPPTEGTLRVFQKQKIKADLEQAERTAWRNTRDWVMAQMALMESCDAPMDQVFLPYLANRNGATLYDYYCSGQLLLGDGGN